jgi:hypothetical protein
LEGSRNKPAFTGLVLAITIGVLMGVVGPSVRGTRTKTAMPFRGDPLASGEKKKSPAAFRLPGFRVNGCGGRI